MRYFVTGGAGYIGSHVVDALLNRGHEVIAYDNLSSGQMRYIEKHKHLTNPKFKFIMNDLVEQLPLIENLKGVDCVYHLAANADIRKGFANRKIDINSNVIGTSNLLEAMYCNNVKRILFASTSAVLGELDIDKLPASETIAMPEQTSLYGATKLAGEGLLSAYCEGMDLEAYAFRFVTVLGPRYSHGFVFDFVKKLIADPNRIEVLGNGKGIKSSVHVSDVVSALITIGEYVRPAQNKKRKYEVFNIGNDVTYRVSDAVQWVCDAMGLRPNIVYDNEIKGWPGDIPYIHLDTTKIKSYGWSVSYTPKQAVYETVEWLLNNKWILEARK